MNAERLLALYNRVSDSPDAISRLRRFVLDMAVRGKLVEQDPDDESASELLKRIKAEKARLVKAREIRDKPDLPPVEPSDQAHPIPSNWKWVRFGNIVDFSAGRTPARNNPSFWNTGEYPWISIADMEDGRVIESTKETVSEEACRVAFKSDPEPAGTMIMSFKLTIGKMARLGMPAFHNEAIISIRPHLTELDPYLFKALPDLSKGGETKGAIKGATLNRESISNILIPLPPLAEQRRIVAKVEELMGLLDGLEAARQRREETRDRLTVSSLARLTAADAEPETFPTHASFTLNALSAVTTRPDQIKQLRQTILNLAVRGKLVEQDPKDEPASVLLKQIYLGIKGLGVKHSVTRLDDDEVPFELPAGWIWARIGEICSKTGSGSTPRGGRDVYKKTGIPFLRSQNVYDDGLRLDNVAYIDVPTHDRMKGTRVLPGDLLLNITGGSIGRCCRVPINFGEANVSQHVAIIRPAIGEMAAFLHRLVLSPYFQAFIFGEQTGAGRGGLPKNRMDKM